MASALAYCGRSRQYYQLVYQPETHTVTDFLLYKPSAPTQTGPSSETFVTDPSLCPCPQCGGRTVAGCGCAAAQLPCEPHVGFRFSCIYCRYLQVLSIRENAGARKKK